jgi:hypothetical protein
MARVTSVNSWEGKDDPTQHGWTVSLEYSQEKPEQSKDDEPPSLDKPEELKPENPPKK